MKVVIAPDSFKESATAKEVANAIKNGWKRIIPHADVHIVPMSDGGEGVMEILVEATNGTVYEEYVTGPDGVKVQSKFGILGDNKTAVIESALAAGLDLLPLSKRDPYQTTSKGVGELILSALEKGVENIIIGLGGTATNDGGVGMLQALGIKFLDEQQNEVPVGGINVSKIATIDATEMDERLKKTTFKIASDVENPLFGPNGASHIFGPQKGASPEMVKELDKALTHYGKLIDEWSGKDISSTKGAGAAGGMGAGILTFFQAEICNGAELVMEKVKMASYLENAEIVIIGEGRLDGQTIMGKTPIRVAKAAKQSGAFVIALAGSLGAESQLVHNHGVDVLFPIVSGITNRETAFAQTLDNLERTAENIAKLIHFKNNEVVQ